MFKLWWLLYYFDHPDRPQEGINGVDGISRESLWMYLVYRKHFCENWLDTILRYYYSFNRYSEDATDTKGLRRASHQIRKVEDLIDRAIKKEYLKVSSTTQNKRVYTDEFLTTDWEGRNFMKLLPFLEATAREYGFTKSIVSAVIITVIISILGTIRFLD